MTQTASTKSALKVNLIKGSANKIKAKEQHPVRPNWNLAYNECFSILLDRNGKNARDTTSNSLLAIDINLFPASKNPFAFGVPKMPRSVTEKLL